MDHARLSASASERWIKCPGSVEFNQWLEDSQFIKTDTSSDVAMEGTVAHYIGEICLKELVNDNNWKISADKYLGETVVVNPQGNDCKLASEFISNDQHLPSDWGMFEVDHYMIRSVDIFINYVKMVLRSMGASSKEGIPDDVEIEIEAKVDLSHLGRQDLGGRIDVRITQFMKAMHVIDYKHGFIPVNPKQKSQLMIYGLGDDVKANMAPEKVILTIIQPRCFQNDDISTWTISSKDLRNWGRNFLIRAAEQTDLFDARISCGEDQCRWCRAGGHCEILHDRILEIASNEFNEIVESPTLKNVKEIVAKMNMNKVLKIKALETFMEAVFEQINERIESEIFDGRWIPGWKLVRSRSNRTWKEGAEEELKTQIPEDILYEVKIKSPAKLEKEKRGKYKYIVKKLAERTPGDPILVPSSDRRKSLNSQT